MRVAIVTESVHARTWRAESVWCARLAEGLREHTFDLYALDARPEGVPASTTVGRIGVAPTARPSRTLLRGRSAAAPRRGPLLAAYEALVRALVDPRAADSFGPALYALATAARGARAAGLLRSAAAVDILGRVWRTPGAAVTREAGTPRLEDALVAADLLERCLRPLGAAWQGPGPGTADVCHVLGGGPALLPALMARHEHGVPLLVTEHGLHLRERLRGYRDAPYTWPVRALLCSFHQLLAAEGYRQAGLITPGSAFDRRWQEHSGADPARIRVVHEGTGEAERPAAGPEPEGPVLAWFGPLAPRGGLAEMLDAFAQVRAEHPEARLRVVGAAPAGAAGYERHCREAAARFGAGAVAFTGTPAGRLADALAESWAVVFSGADGPRPRLLAEAMLTGRPLVATDVGATRELVGPTGLLVPPLAPRPLAAACLALLDDPERRARLGHAGRLRAQELYGTEPTVEAFRAVYLELAAQVPQPQPAPAGAGRTPQPFALPAEYWRGGRPAAAMAEGVPAG